MSQLVRPKVLSPRGIIEGTHYVPTGGFALKAINSLGVCVEFAIVRTHTEYVEAMAALGQVLEAKDPVPFDFERAVRRAYGSTPSCAAPSVPSALRLVL